MRILRSELIAACPSLRVHDPDRGRPPRRHRATARNCCCGCPVRARDGEQGSGDPADRRASAAGAAVRSTQKRKRRVLEQYPIELAGSRSPRPSRRSLPHVRRGRSSLPASTAACSTPRTSIRCCWDVSASIRLRCWSDRRLHDRLCGDLAGQRCRDAGLDVCGRRRRIARAARARSQYNASNVDRRDQSAGEDAGLCRCQTTDVANGSDLSGILLLLLDGVASVLARYTFVLHSSPRPTVFLTWLIVPGIVYAWRRGEQARGAPG